MEELDLILLQQLVSARKRMKLVKRMKIMSGENDPGLNEVEKSIQSTIQFLESMIENKDLIQKKKINKPKSETIDVLARNPVQSFYRDAFIISMYGMKIMSDSFESYMSFFKKKK